MMVTKALQLVSRQPKFEEQRALLEWNNLKLYVPAEKGIARQDVVAHESDDRSAFLGVENSQPLPKFILNGKRHYKQVL